MSLVQGHAGTMLLRQSPSYVRETLDGRGWVERLEAERGDAAAVAWARSRLGEVDDEGITRIADGRRELVVDGRTVESFRQITLDQALALLVPAPVPSAGSEGR